MSKLCMVLLLSFIVVPLIGNSNSVAQEEATGQGIFESRFNEIDTNKDGKISRNEHKEYLEKRAEKNFTLVDTNKDGFISREEAKAAVSERMEKRKEKMKEWQDQKEQ